MPSIKFDGIFENSKLKLKIGQVYGTFFLIRTLWDKGGKKLLENDYQRGERKYQTFHKWKMQKKLDKSVEFNGLFGLSKFVRMNRNSALKTRLGYFE